MLKALVFLLAVGAQRISFSAQPFVITSGPAFVKAPNAALAGTLQVTTDVPTRVSVSVSDGHASWQRSFYDFATAHSVPLLGFKAGRTNQISVTAYDRYRRQVTAPQPLVFITSPLPTNFPNVVLLHSEPARMEPGYTLFNVYMRGGTLWYVMIVDNAGEVVWYNVAPSTADVRQLPNGDLFMPWTTNFVEMNLLGQTVNTWLVPLKPLGINAHDGVPTDHGTILYLSTATERVDNYPSSMTNPLAPLTATNILYEKVVEISTADASVLNTWSPVNVLDPRRITYMIDFWEGAMDSEHINAVIEDPRDDSLIVSVRHQNAVVKISRDTGELRWILGPPANWGPEWQPYLLTPVGTPFVWQYAQHSPIITPQGTLIMFDNGNYRASPFDPGVPDANNYSRAVEYSINEQTMEISQVWEYGRTNVVQQIYADHEGNAEPEPQTGNVLIDFATVSYVNGVAPSPFGPAATMTRITEVTHDAVPQIVFDLAISLYDNTNVSYKDCQVYRSHRIPDLYPHLAQSVGDLSVTRTNGPPLLEFSADDSRTYTVQASTNLADWETIGVAVENGQQSGNFSFEDNRSAQPAACYYRVLTR